MARVDSEGPMPVGELLDLAVRISEALATLHRRGAVHHDVRPATIVADGDGTPVLIDAGSGGDAGSGDIAAADGLTYAAPERTGRTGRPLDHRADLYSLGATLYAFATGRPPFPGDDPLDLIHAHLTRLPEPPAVVEPRVPAMLSAIVMRLLEKEPDRRYQSAEGLAYDLRRLRESPTAGDFPLGERDFPPRLSAPPRPAGRAAESAALAAAFTAAMAGGSRAVLVTGRPGVGKSTLTGELRPIVARAGGWFVTGKFEQFRQGFGADAVQQILRALLRRLLAEPADRLDAVRGALLDDLGPNAGLAAGPLPELTVLLGVEPDTAGPDPALLGPRLQQAALAILRSVASADRPVVIVLDDLQWATPLPLSFIDAVLTDDGLAGVLVAGCYRDEEPGEPLLAVLERWAGLGISPPRLALTGLDVPELADMLAAMLRTGPAAARDLATLLHPPTGGNPFDAVEMVDALRREQVLRLGDDGWHWDAAAVRRHLGAGDVAGLLDDRIGGLPPETVTLLTTMACLGGGLTPRSLTVAAGLAPGDLDRLSDPARDAGLLLAGADGAPAFRHDRVQQAVVARLSGPELTDLRLTVARRVAAVPDLATVAAEQYLHVMAVVGDPAERRRIAGLFIEAADEALVLANHVLRERYLVSALDLLAPDRDLAAGRPGEHDGTVLRVAVAWHGSLTGAGRLDEADAVFAWLTRLSTDPSATAEASATQITSLTSRGRMADAVDLGLATLRSLGLEVPSEPAELGAGVADGLTELYALAAGSTAADDLARPEYGDPRIVALAGAISRTVPAAFFSDQVTMAWLVLQAVRLWSAYGPAPALVGPLGNVCFVTPALRGDYRTGNSFVRRVLEVGRRRGYEPGTSEALFLYALGSGPWFEPLEDLVRQARRAHEGLTRGGSMQFAASTFYVSLPDLLDCGPTVGDLVAEAETAMAYAARVGNTQAHDAFIAYRQLGRAMRGETAAPGSLTGDGFDQEEHLAALAANPTAAANVHVCAAVAAAVMGDEAALVRHAGAVAPLMPFIVPTYLTVAAHLTRALACVTTHRATPAPEVLAELDEHAAWFAARCADAPGHLSHLCELVEAERAALRGDPAAAAGAFDAARRSADRHSRPWHSGLIAERAAGFYRSLGAGRPAAALLEDAAAHYRKWGATAKIDRLEQEHPSLRRADAGAATDAIDMIGIVAASQALSSETTMSGLLARISGTLCALAGATAARVLLRRDDGWFRPVADDEPGAEAPIPFSVVRYAGRTGQPLVIDDAVRDDRFRHDPYFAGQDRCSLLVSPIHSRGRLTAMLLLENRNTRAAFSGGHLDAVAHIAGQLAVSLDNAQLYASLERKVAERTNALATANRRLELLSSTDPLTGLANRRQLSGMLEREWRARPGAEISAIILDVDHFKQFNDEYGHLAGDDCLRLVGEALNRHVRGGDLLARYGGEEFVVVLPGCDLTLAAQVGDRLRQAVVELDLPHAGSPFGVVTISGGCAATTPNDASRPDDLLGQADIQLYRAKHDGRNTVRP
ncbi:serine/threonine protein kinase [Actinoplanes sp. NBRC 103695]|nr:serine/threonine protein kinase [Actinoplanes sp. NBRC 103695]